MWYAIVFLSCSPVPDGCENGTRMTCTAALDQSQEHDEGCTTESCLHFLVTFLSPQDTSSDQILISECFWFHIRLNKNDLPPENMPNTTCQQPIRNQPCLFFLKLLNGAIFVFSDCLPLTSTCFVYFSFINYSKVFQSNYSYPQLNQQN